MSLWNILLGIFELGDARGVVDACISHGNSQSMTSIEALSYFVNVHLAKVLSETSRLETLHSSSSSTTTAEHEEFPVYKELPPFPLIVKALSKSVMKQTRASTESHQQQSLTRTMADTMLWIQFCDSFFEGRKVRIDINIRAATWRLLAHVVHGHCVNWDAVYKRHVIPFVNLYKKGVLVDPSAQSSVSECSTANVDVERSWLKSSEHRALLRGVLYIYTRQHRSVGYVQNMLFIASVLVYVFMLHIEPAEIPSHLKRATDANGELLATPFVGTSDAVLKDDHGTDKRYVLYDIYTCFYKIAGQMHDMWVVVDTQNGEIKPDMARLPKTCKEVFQLVSLYDTELYEHLNLSEEYIEPLLLFQRQLQTVFSDCLPIYDVVCLWDYLLAGFVDKISFLTRLKHACAAFLIAHRRLFLDRVPHTQSYIVMDGLLKYPWAENVNVTTLVNTTIELTEKFYSTSFSNKKPAY